MCIRDSVSPEAASGGPIGLVEDGDIIEIDIPGRSLHIEVTEEEFDRRRKTFVPIRKPRKPAMAKYAALVGPADTGAVIDEMCIRDRVSIWGGASSSFQ